jgi:TatA/E family protein of Tat protein translocase
VRFGTGLPFAAGLKERTMGLGIGSWELVLLLVVALLLFGKRLPEVARNLGKGIMEFKRGLYDIQDG